MEKIALAQLISYISSLASKPLDVHDILYIDGIVRSGVDVDASTVNELLSAIAEHDELTAMHAYRALTRTPLIESKKAIESFFAKIPSRATAA